MSIKRLVFALMVVLLGVGQAGANKPYLRMGNDRILLLNDDSASRRAVSGESYNATNTSAAYYWVHTNCRRLVGPNRTLNLKLGTNHVYYATGGLPLWILRNVYTGSA